MKQARSSVFIDSYPQAMDLIDLHRNYLISRIATKLNAPESLIAQCVGVSANLSGLSFDESLYLIARDNDLIRFSFLNDLTVKTETKCKSLFSG